MPGNTRFMPYKKAVKAGDFTGEVQKPKSRMIVAQIKNPDGDIIGPSITLPSDVTPQQLQLLVDQLLKEEEEATPYSFFVETTEILKSIQEDILEGMDQSAENMITIVYQPKALFRVRPVTRCSSSLTGHSEAILSVSFSPDGSQLATGSGDTTVRIWDLNTETPQFTLKGHKDWVQIVAWSPDGSILASGSMDSTVRLWNPKTGAPLGDALRAHTKSITSIVWEPMMSNKECKRFASSSRDGTVRVWDATLRKTLFVLAQHTQPIMCMRWGGENMIFTGSRDKTIKVWDAKDVSIVLTYDKDSTI